MSDPDLSGRPALNASGLGRRYRGEQSWAVSGVDLDVARREILALLGPSGCGKTTTLRMIAGFDRPDAGRVRLDGRDITDLVPEERGIGFVFQDYALFPHLNVAANVGFGLHRRQRAEVRARVADLIDRVGLSEVAEKMPHQVSGGQQQRVALARALAPEPGLVLLDEPFSNLDAARRVTTRQDVRKILKRTGAAAIIVTHDQEEALALADRIAVMQAGQVLQIGASEEVYRRPVNESVASFLGNSNILDGEAAGGIAMTPLGPVLLDRAAHGAVRLAIRPEQIVLSRDAAGGPVGIVRGREFRGHDQIYWIRAGDTDVVALSHETADFPDGTRIGLSTRAPAVLLADG